MSQAYKRAGVDIDAGEETVQRIRRHVERTARAEVIGEFGGFGGMFALGAYKNPVLVSGTDGVGTKLKVAFALDRHDTIGIDCVAMCVNDIVVQGAEPLFFLDYLATGKLVPAQAEAIVKGIADGCEQAGCALIGGETAEMPGMYPVGEYDIAGFAVGVVERERVLHGKNIVPGDQLIGLAASGLHSNGYSLARQVLLAERVADFAEIVPGSKQTLGEALLTPTRIYVNTFLELMKHFPIKAGAHITGGGLVGNIPRMLPPGCGVAVDRQAWEVPAIFQWIQQLGQLALSDMVRTFNLGIGMVLCVPAAETAAVVQAAQALGEQATVIGQVTAGEKVFAWVGDDGI
jgi:phosphoribosylformylglycinamidine cyclo-ligase